MKAALILLSLLGSTVNSEVVDPAKNHDVVTHHSLIGPFISEWWQGGLPHWDFGSATVVTDKYIRVVPDKQSRVGWLWNEEPSYLSQWEATVTMRVHSRRNPGADGLAVWYVEKPLKYDPNNKEHTSNPNLWGNSVDFKGIGIVFDTYDNDGQRDNPVVSVIQGTGDAKQKWEIENDLLNQAKMRCVYEFRNTPKGENVKARILYADKTLQVFLSTAGDSKETYCGQVNNIDLPIGYHFGVTATTGHLADNHDVYGFVVTAGAEAIQAEDAKIYGAGGGHQPTGARATPHRTPHPGH